MRLDLPVFNAVRMKVEQATSCPQAGVICPTNKNQEKVKDNLFSVGLHGMFKTQPSSL